MVMTDMTLDVARNCLSSTRRAEHPCALELRIPAAAESCIVKLFSESGRLWGHLKHLRWCNVCCSFDWFCGDFQGMKVRFLFSLFTLLFLLYTPFFNSLFFVLGIVESEQRRMLFRAIACAVVSFVAVYYL